PADSERVGEAVSAVLDRSPEAVLDGAIADLDGEFADVAAAFEALEAVPRMARVKNQSTGKSTAVAAANPPAEAGTSAHRLWPPQASPVHAAARDAVRVRRRVPWAGRT
ncbi:hypothetical protein Q7689_11005, partial [Nocardiopsis tropica]|nr:hypothetical protein [Nocardiopsis tropica]